MLELVLVKYSGSYSRYRFISDNFSGILSNDGIVLAAERRNTNKLLDEVFHSEKIYKLNDDMVCSVAGLTSDANLLTNELRLIGQRYKYSYGEEMLIN